MSLTFRALPVMFLWCILLFSSSSLQLNPDITQSFQSLGDSMQKLNTSKRANAAKYELHPRFCYLAKHALSLSLHALPFRTDGPLPQETLASARCLHILFSQVFIVVFDTGRRLGPRATLTLEQRYLVNALM